MKLKFWILFTGIIGSCQAVDFVSLDGEWLFKDASGQYTDLKATVPGGIYSDLMSNNIIEDIYFGNNDLDTRWVGKTNWTYYRTFTVEQRILDNENINLVLEGVDTFAEVYVNDVLIGETVNMFVRYIYDIKPHLKLGDNNIELRFISTVEVGASIAAQQALDYVVPPQCPPTEYNGECNVNMIRKMQASYSWDWGPAFPSVGIWKTLYVESYNESVIRYVATEVSYGDYEWLIDAEVFFANNSRGFVEGFLKLLINVTQETQVSVSKTINIPANEYGEFVFREKIAINEQLVQPWWPNGFGEQHLYPCTITFSSFNEKENDSVKEIKIGFRTIELVQEEVGTGLSFYFKVNGLPIFMKGSNEIPLDILPERGQDKNLIKTMLTTVRDSNMNMLRVWGGGVYESDYFYDLADEYGILIWQDFMFACAMYPSNDYFLENVINEVRHQVNRLRYHTSIALFAGNNENEAALRQNWYGTSNNFTRYYDDYISLYINTIQTEFNRITHDGRIFLSSSPSNGKESIYEGYVANNPGDYNFGDVHYYNYVLNPWDSTIYPVSRFTSEYGYQALPSYNSMKTATDDVNNLDIDSDFMYRRQHHPEGNEQMKALIEFNLNLPDKTHPNYTKAFFYYLQIAQAQGIKVETEHYRRFRSYYDKNGLGGTMGALYWQLNDVWLAPTWSGIDFRGQWKMLQYFVNDFFSPVIVTGHINSTNILEIYVVSDLKESQPNVSVLIDVYNWNSITPVYKEVITADIDSGSSKLVRSIDAKNFLSEQNCGTTETARNNCFFYLSVQAEDRNIGPNNYVFPATLKTSSLLSPTVTIESVQAGTQDNIFEIVITTDNIALFVWLETEVKGKFSQNGFVLVEAQKTITFTSEEATSVDDLLKSLTITNLLDKQYL